MDALCIDALEVVENYLPMVIDIVRRMGYDGGMDKDSVVEKVYSSIGVHANHCCVLHGCKYGDGDCPVEDEVVQQQVPCEFCREPDELVRAQAAIDEELALLKKIGYA